MQDGGTYDRPVCRLVELNLFFLQRAGGRQGRNGIDQMACFFITRFLISNRRFGPGVGTLFCHVRLKSVQHELKPSVVEVFGFGT